jgi:hypothetical protein
MTLFTIEDLTPSARSELLERTLRPKGLKAVERRKELCARWLAMRERPDELVRQRIRETFHTPEISAEVQRWATGIFNPIKRLSSLAAQAYTVPPIRTVDGLGKRANRDYLRALEGLRFNARCRAWNRWQVAMNTVAVLVKPARRANGDATLDFDKVTGACAEAVPHPEAPFGDTPAILAYSLVRDMSVPTDPRQEEVIATVDARWWVFWNDRQEILRTVEHELGMFPGSVLRATEPEGEDVDDYWDADFGRATTQALKEAGLAGAIMGWLRKTQFGKLVHITRQEGQAGPQETEGEEGQPLGHPEAPLELVNATVGVADLEVSVEKFREHMGLLLAEAAHAMTGTASILEEPTPGQTQTDTASVHRLAALRLLQGEQVEYLVPFELDLQIVMAAMAAKIGMRGLPSADAIREGFDVKHAPLTLLGTPSEMMNLAITGTKFGVTDQIEYLMRTEGLTEEEAQAKVKMLAERVADLNELRASRMSAADPLEVRDQEVRPELPGEGAAATTGRRGGRASPPSAA